MHCRRPVTKLELAANEETVANSSNCTKNERRKKKRERIKNNGERKKENQSPALNRDTWLALDVIYSDHYLLLLNSGAEFFHSASTLSNLQWLEPTHTPTHTHLYANSSLFIHIHSNKSTSNNQHSLRSANHQLLPVFHQHDWLIWFPQESYSLV